MFLCSLPTVLNVFRGLKNKLSTLTFHRLIKIKLRKNLLPLLLKNCYCLLILTCLLLAGNMANHLKKNAGSLIIQRTVISPAWFLIFSQIYVLEENIYPWRPYQLTNRNWQVKYCLRTIINSISHWKNDNFFKYHRTPAKRSRWNGIRHTA